MKAMSYWTSPLLKQGSYGSLPKVEIPENTESACGYGEHWYRCLRGLDTGNASLVPACRHRREADCTTTSCEAPRLSSGPRGRRAQRQRPPRRAGVPSWSTCCSIRLSFQRCFYSKDPKGQRRFDSRFCGHELDYMSRQAAASFQA